VTLPNRQKFTYKDYCSWDDGQRWELIYGEPYAMSSPNADHQEIVFNLCWAFHTFLKGRTCKMFPAPFDVRLNIDNRDDTVVQPDLSLICDASKRTSRGCYGAPDMVIEVTSPSTRMRDFNEKKNLYLVAGVKEYWIINPEINVTQVYTLNKHHYEVKVYSGSKILPVSVLPGCKIDMSLIYPSFR
jgi:Uma2 family endonuclease